MFINRLITTVLSAAATGMLLAVAPPDFSFTDRDGEQRTLSEVITSAQPEARIYLLLFDPDCDDCHAVIDHLRDDPAIRAGVADATVKIVAIYPVDEIPEPSDPNIIRYRQVCQELPEEWIVGTDNGSISEGDLYQWETLPLLIKYDKGASAMECGHPGTGIYR